MEIQIWAKERFLEILRSPENASRDQAIPLPIRPKIHLETTNEHGKL